MKVIVVTGSDTGVGKTIATAALASLELGTGKRVAVIKPAQTGVGPEEPGDLSEVHRLAGEVDTYEGVRLPDPLSPPAAARVAGVGLPTLQAQRDLVAAVARDHDVTLLEGSGGVLVPLGNEWDLLDLAAGVRDVGHEVTFVVVVRAGLGTLNHAALTVQAIENHGLNVSGTLIGAWPAVPDLAAQQNLLDLPLLTGVPLLGRIPEGAVQLPVEDFRAAAPHWLPHL